MTMSGVDPNHKASHAPNRKRSAPVSASAFSFALSTPSAKKPCPSVSSGSGPRTSVPPGLSSRPTSATKETSRRVESPLSKLFQKDPFPTSNHSYSNQPNLPSTPVKTPSLSSARATTPLNSHVIPIETPRRTAVRLTQALPLTNLASPATESKQPARPPQLLHSVLQDVTSPFIVGKAKKREQEQVQAPLVNLQSLSSIKVDVEIKEKKSIQDENEGIGVSPRKIKVSSRQGQISYSTHLSSLVSSSELSLLLFYTSLRNSIYPTNPSTRPVSILEHVSTSATLQVRILTPLQGPTHHSLIYRCRIIRNAGLTSAGEQQTDEDGETVLVLFQTLPSGAERLGLDPGVAREGSRSYDAGIWAPMGELVMPSPISEDSLYGDIRVLFATRYLVTDSI